MNWKKITDLNSLKNKVFLICFRDEVGVCEFCEEEEDFYFMATPAYSTVPTRIPEKFFKRITHWAPVPEKPEESNGV